MRRSVRRAAWVVLLGGVACGPSRTNLDPASVQMPAAERLTQGQIASIAAAVNAAQIRNGQIARERGASGSVQTFGNQLVDEYSAMNADLAGAMTAARVPAADHWLVDQVRTRREAVEESLAGTAGTEFDRAFMRRQRDLSRWFVALLDHSLLPSAASERMRQYLMGVRLAAAEDLAIALEAAGDR